MTNPTLRGAHLVGSVNLPDTESVMRTSAAALGGHLSRIPDGETGERFHWIGFQPGRLEVIDGLERVGRRPAISRGIDLRGLRVTEGADPSTFAFPPLGYAEAAIDSYATFARLRQEGAIPLKTRFLVSLPTPAAVVGFSFMVASDRPGIEPVYAKALFRELDQILDAIPHDDLAIQWDWALEFCLIEESGYWGPIAPWWDDLWQGLADRAADQLGRIPADVEVGVHLCYGDIGETHFTEPADAGNLVRVANVIAAATDREINWVHLPVPINRDDDAYFAPLAGLALPPDTEVYLGLVHREDGVEGAQRRVVAAAGHLSSFGISTECGFGRAEPGSAEIILDIHREVLDSFTARAGDLKPKRHFR